jgi:hypothetical protein
MSRNMSPAARRYFLRIAVLMSAYVGLLLFAKLMFKHGLAHGAPAFGLALLPALPIIGVFWAVMRLIVEETDEFIRMLHVRQCLVATGFCLTVMTVWEWLQNFELVSAGNGGFGAAFFWFMGLGVGALYNRLTLGTAGGCA